MRQECLRRRRHSWLWGRRMPAALPAPAMPLQRVSPLVQLSLVTTAFLACLLHLEARSALLTAMATGSRRFCCPRLQISQQMSPVRTPMHEFARPGQARQPTAALASQQSGQGSASCKRRRSGHQSCELHRVHQRFQLTRLTRAVAAQMAAAEPLTMVYREQVARAQLQLSSCPRLAVQLLQLQSQSQRRFASARRSAGTRHLHSHRARHVRVHRPTLTPSSPSTQTVHRRQTAVGSPAAALQAQDHHRAPSPGGQR